MHTPAARTCRLVTLGCKVNQYETQYVKEALEQHGWREAGPGERAELCIVNTCTVTMEGDANGAPHPDPSSYAKKFTGKYEHRTVEGGIGHNLPQEAPKVFAEAILDIADA